MSSKLNQADVQFQITESGVEEQLLKLKNLPEELKKELVKAVKKGNAIMKADEKPRVQQFTGATAKSITSRVKIGALTGSVTGVTGPSNKQLFAFRMSQYGRAAGAQMPPAERLVPWVEKRWGVSRKEADKAAKSLAWSIHKKGVQGTPVARPVMERNKGRVNEILRQTVDWVVERLSVK